jgi:sortase A
MAPTLPFGPPLGRKVVLPLALVIMLLLALGTVGAVVERPTSGRPQALLPADTVPDTVVESPTTSTIPVVAPAQPIPVPDDPYATEPVVRLGTIEIPKLGLVSPLMNGVTMNNIDLGPSRWPGTGSAGQPGNMVVAGHRVTHTHPFLHIDQLVPGDRVIFDVNGQRHIYSVTSHQIVLPTAMWIAAPSGTATATLFACHPPHSARERYVVHLALVTS